MEFQANFWLKKTNIYKYCATITNIFLQRKKMKKSLIAMLALAGSLNAATLATVNGIAITDDIVPDEIKAQFSQNPDMKAQFIESEINRQLILAEAKKAKVENQKEYKIMTQLAEENVAIQLWEKTQFDAMKVSDAEAQSFYNQNKSQFVVPAQVRAKHILVADKATADNITKELSVLKGDALNAKFSEIARAKSIDKGSAANGGELGWFPKSQMVPAFGEAAFALKNGEMTKKPVQSQFGYHIILKQDSRAQNTLPFDTVKENIIGNLKAGKLQGEMGKKIDDLRKNAKIEYK